MISATLNTSGDYVLLETDSFKAQIFPTKPLFAQYYANVFGCSTYVNTPNGWIIGLNSSYMFLKLAHKDKAYQGQLWPHATDVSANGGRWKNRTYGTRTVAGINEAFCRAEWYCIHPVSDQQKALGFTVVMATEWVVKEGQSRCYRNDSITVDQDIYDIQANYFSSVDEATAYLQGLIKVYVDDCETAKTWNFGTLSGGRSVYTSDRMIGTASTKITVDPATGNTGKVVYQTLSGENWSDYHHYGYWIRTRDGNTPNSIRWYIIDSVGGKQYLGQPVSLVKDYILNDTRTAHDYTGRWRQIYADLTGITRGNVTQWGFECLTDDLIDFLVDDVFRYAWVEIDQRTALENIVYPTITYPSTFRDVAAFPNWPLTADFTKLTHKPFAVHFSSRDKQGVVVKRTGDLAPGQFLADNVRQYQGYWDGSVIEWNPGTSYDGQTGAVYTQVIAGGGSLINTQVLAEYNDYRGRRLEQPVWDFDGGAMLKTLSAGTIASAIMVKSKFSVQWTRIRAADPASGEQSVVLGTRVVGRATDLELLNYSFESVFCSEYATSRTAGRVSLMNFFDTWDTPPFAGKTIADLPAVSTIQKLVQSNPSDRYETDLYTRDLITRLRDTNTGYVAPAATPGIVLYRYDDAWLKNTPWDTTMTDNRVDYLQLWCDLIKEDQGLHVCAESTAAVPEGYLEIPHYNTAHTATLENGDAFRIFFWVYADIDGFFILRDRNYFDDQPAYYDPIVEDGRTYFLSYTYPLSGASLASAYGTSTEFGQPTIRDFRINQIQHIVDNYNVDAVALSEDCTFYHHGSYGAADLVQYNLWRTTIAGLSVATEFPRQVPGSPLSNTNLVLVDDPVLWSWKAWVIKRFMQDVATVCHARGVLLIVDVNLESTLRTRDRYNLVYDQSPSNFIQDAGGSWFTRDFSNYGKRYGVDLRDVAEAADLAYTWMYGNFNPWGFWQNFNDYLSFLNGKGFEGRVLMGIGLYPDPNPPTAQEVEDALALCGQYGYGMVVPASKQWGSYSTDYLWHIDRGAQTIADFTLVAGVLTCDHARGVYFPKAAAALTLSIPSGSTVKHYSKVTALKATYAPYTGTSLVIVAGDSVLIQTGTVPSILEKPLPYRSPYLRGLGMLSDIIQRLCLDGGLQTSDIDTSDLAPVNVYGDVFDGGSAADAIQRLQSIFFFDIVEKNGKLTFLRRPRAIVATFAYDDLIPIDESQIVEIRRLNDFDLPREIVLSYVDYTRSYQQNTQRSTLQNVGTKKVTVVNIPTSIDGDYARQTAEILHQEAWSYRDKYKFKLPLANRNILPGDSVNLIDDSGETTTVRILSRSVGDDISFDGVRDVTALNSTAVGGGDAFTHGIISLVNSTILPLNAPLIDVNVVNTPGIFFGVAGDLNSDAYPNAGIYYSTDNIDFKFVSTTSINSVYGAATSALPDADGSNNIDHSSTVVINLISGLLSSISYDELINGGNACMLGDECLQFMTATQLSTTSWRLSGLLRGRRGSEWASIGHVTGDKFTLITGSGVSFLPLPLALTGVPLFLKSVTGGTLVTDATTINFTPRYEHLKPMSPVNVRGYRQVNKDVVISWNRRSRILGGWNNNAEVPIDFGFERYRIQIYDGVTSAVIITVDNLTTPNYTFTSSDQQDYYGAGIFAPSPFKVRIYQVSDIIGFGQAAIGFIL